MFPPARWPPTRCPSSATTATSWPAARPVLRCWPPPACRKSWIWRWSPICPPSKASVPFLHFFDGFRTSHEIQKIDGDRLRRDQARCVDWDAVEAFRERALNPEHPASARHRAEPRHLLPEPRSCQQVLSTPLPDIVEEYMKKVGETDRPQLQAVRLRTARPTPSASSSPWAPAATPSRRPSTTSTRKARRSA